GINTHPDKPFEILHTYLLGNSKYYICVYAPLVQSLRLSVKYTIWVLCIHGPVFNDSEPSPEAPRNYIAKYKNSLIGKHFKNLSQLAVFHLHGLCSTLLYDMWKAAGELGALLWYPEINNLEEHLVS
ncbi:hypothetical protein FA13DRAFT_1635304, partial [Coprinellus micaceus]